MFSVAYLIKEIPREDFAEKQGILMDTYVVIRIKGVESQKVVSKIWNLLEDLDKKLDRFKKESEIYKINNNAGKWIEVSKEVLEVINKALYFAKISDGYFDPTVGPLMEIWGFYNSSYRLPRESEIKRALELVNWRYIEVRDNKVRLLKDKASIDLGGIAKGYAIEKALEICRDSKIDEVYIDFGGNIAVLGKPERGDYWEIGIKHPRKDGIIGKIKIKEGVVATSGDYERYFVKDGIRYCHIMNPKNGFPASDVMSVTVISKNGIEADALSTTFFVLGEKALDFRNKFFPDVEFVMIDKNGRIIRTSGVIFELEK